MENIYKWGLDLISDIKELYGENCEHINNKRYELFNALENEIDEIKILRNIIQNPVPITKEEFSDWVTIKNKTLSKYRYGISLRVIHTLRNVEDFVYNYHIVKEV